MATCFYNLSKKWKLKKKCPHTEIQVKISRTFFETLFLWNLTIPSPPTLPPSPKRVYDKKTYSHLCEILHPKRGLTLGIRLLKNLNFLVLTVHGKFMVPSRDLVLGKILPQWTFFGKNRIEKLFFKFSRHYISEIAFFKMAGIY